MNVLGLNEVGLDVLGIQCVGLKYGGDWIVLYRFIRCNIRLGLAAIGWDEAG